MEGYETTDFMIGLVTEDINYLLGISISYWGN